MGSWIIHSSLRSSWKLSHEPTEKHGLTYTQLWIFYYSAEKTTKGFPKVNKEHEITTKINCSLVASDQTILSETIKQSDTCVTKGPYSLNFSTKIVTVIEY